jgi:hypothetical protein
VTTGILAQQIRTGNGGDGSASAGTGGSGGNISLVTVTGDIGNFDQTFGASNDLMGGLITGLAGAGATPGKTGGISSVKATRIAAVFAGDASTLATALSSANAVFSLAAVTASAIGADVAGNGFSYTERGSNTDFDLGTDWAVDGVVIARAAGFTAPSATPLKVLTV